MEWGYRTILTMGVVTFFEGMRHHTGRKLILLLGFLLKYWLILKSGFTVYTCKKSCYFSSHGPFVLLLTYSVFGILCYNIGLLSIHFIIASRPILTLKLLQLKEVIMKRWGKEVPLSPFYRQIERVNPPHQQYLKSVLQSVCG